MPIITISQDALFTLGIENLTPLSVSINKNILIIDVKHLAYEKIKHINTINLEIILATESEFDINLVNHSLMEALLKKFKVNCISRNASIQEFASIMTGKRKHMNKVYFSPAVFSIKEHAILDSIDTAIAVEDTTKPLSISSKCYSASKRLLMDKLNARTSAIFHRKVRQRQGINELLVDILTYNLNLVGTQLEESVA